MDTYAFEARELHAELVAQGKQVEPMDYTKTKPYTDDYVAYVLEKIVQMALSTPGSCVDPLIFIGQKIDCSKYIPGKWVICDCILIKDAIIQIIFLATENDKKISADNDVNLKAYTRAILDVFDGEHDIDTVMISVYQPQYNNMATHTVFKESIYQWAEEFLETEQTIQRIQKHDSLTEKDFSAELQPIAALLAKKSKDYGNSYAKLRDEYGTVAFHIRLADKLSRLKQVDGNGTLVSDESAIDTIRDIIGYCALELVYRKGGN